MSLGTSKFRFPKLTDKDLVVRVSEEARAQGFNIRALTFNLYTGGSLNASDPILEKNPEFNEILNQNSELGSSFNFQIFGPDGKTHFTINISRQQDNPTDNAEINFSPFNDQQRVLANKIIAGLRNRLQAFDSAQVAERVVGITIEAQNKASEVRLQKLEGIANSLIFDQEKYRQQLEKDYETRKGNLESETQKDRDRLREKEGQLDTRLKDVDDRESRHARRALATTIKGTFQQRAKTFQLSEGTIALRRPVYYFTIVLLALFGLMFIISFLATMKLFGLSQESSAESIVRQILIAAAFTSTSVFFIKWSNKWFEKHAEEEFILKRQEIDIDRASWVVELASEWTDRKREIPETLMAKLTTGLFEYETKEPQPLHPVDHLASAILGSSSKATVKLPNDMGEIELDRKSMKNLQRPVDCQ